MSNIKYNNIKQKAYTLLTNSKDKFNNLPMSENYTEKPILTDDDIRQLSETISKAIVDNLTVEIAYYKKPYISRLMGNIVGINQNNKTLIVQVKDDYTMQIKTDTIMEIII